MSRSDKWDRRDRSGFRYIPLYSKRGVIILTLAFFGTMYAINIISYTVGNLITGRF